MPTTPDDLRGDLARPDDLVRMVEENTAEFLLALGRAGGAPEQLETARLSWSLGGSPIDYHNCVVRAVLEPDEADHAVRRSLETLQALGVPGTWHVGPSMRPSDLGERLAAAGFVDGGSEPAMAVDLAGGLPEAYGARGPDGAGVPDRLEIRPVRTVAELRIWATTLARGFGEGEREATWVAEMYRRIGLADPALRHYLGWLGGEPVGTATRYDGAGAAGLYFVMAVPELRRRGIGTAITRAALLDARRAGLRYAVLTSSAAGRRVYERLGFQAYASIRLYEWSTTSEVGS